MSLPCNSQRLVFGILTVALATLTACAGDVTDIDRTQPGKIRKSALAGEWYFRQTVVDVPFTTGVTFIGEQSILERVRFEVSEDFLTAYRTYERVTGSEQPSDLPGSDYQGAPVAAFRIIRHFDVARTYADATGEETNVIQENDFDRPWYEREYLRVDWSQNLLGNFDFMAAGNTGLGVYSQAASYVVTDPESPDAPVFSTQSSKGWADYRNPEEWGTLKSFDYFDVTQKLQLTPDTFDIWYDDGTIEKWPSCWFYDEGPWDCTSQTVKVRASFLKVPQANTRSDYEALYYPDNYIPRDTNGDAIRTKYDDDLGDYRQCTSNEVDCDTPRIPMFDWFGYFRTEREAYDRDYGLTEDGRIYWANRFNIWKKSKTSSGAKIPMAERQIKPIQYYMSPNFPQPLVATAKETAADWNQAFQETVSSLRSQATDEDVFVLVKNSFETSDGKIIHHGERNGDLRFSHLYWVDDPQMESLLGYGPSAADPLTGEIIAASAYVYGGSVNTYAAYAADVIDLLRGEILESEFIEGENVGRAIANIGQMPSANAASTQSRVQKLMDNGLKNRLKGIRDRGPQAYRRNYDAAKSRLAMADNDARFSGLWNTEWAQALESRLGRKLKPSSYLGGNLARALKKHRTKLGARAVDLMAFGDQAVLAQFERLKDLPRDEIVATVRADVFKATALHEVGHTLGLRHNFAGSTDALNYFDHYWDIRDPDAEALDLPTNEEAKAGLRDYSYSSIMDYGATWSSDIQGLGKYDVAAIKFGYGQLVEAFVNEPYWPDHDILSYVDVDQAVLKWTHYTDLPDLFATTPEDNDGLENMRRRFDVPMSEIIAWKTAAPGFDDYTDKLVPYRFCSDEYVMSKWYCDMFDEGADSYEIVQHTTQHWRDYYIFRAFKRNERYLDPITYYYNTYGRSMAPMAMHYQMWIYDGWYDASEWSYFYSDLGGPGDGIDQEEWALDKHAGLARTAAAMSAVNFLAEVIGTPEPGSYYISPDEPNVMTWWTNDEDVICGPGEDSYTDPCSAAYVPVGKGRYAYSEYNPDTGYYFYDRLRVVGSFWDKLAAVETLADPTTHFLGVDDIADYTTYVMGFNEAFPHATGAMFGAIINDDYRYYAPSVSAENELEMPALFESADLANSDEPTPTLASRVGPFVDPATNFTVALYAMYYGMALLNLNFDQSFNDGAKIWLDGSGEAFTPLPGATIATFINPFNGRTYKAQKSPDELTYSLGYEMLSRADALRATIEAEDPACFNAPLNTPACDVVAGQLWTLRNLIENVEVVRGYYDVFGYAWW